MVIYIYIFFLNLFYLSYEATELPRFDSVYIVNVKQEKRIEIYLNTSVYKKGDIIEISIQFKSEEIISLFFIQYCFGDTLDFSKAYNTEYAYKKDRYEWLDVYTYTFYFNIKMNNNAKYFLFVINNYFVQGTIYHLNRPNTTAIELIRHSSLIINSSSYVYLINSFENETNIYFSFSFESNKNNLNQYEIYYTMDNYNDDKAFKYLKSAKLGNPRKKNDKYNFYYNFRLIDKSKKYICLQPRNVDGNKN